MKSLRLVIYLFILLLVSACGGHNDQETIAGNAKFTEIYFPATGAEVQLRTETTIAHLAAGLQTILDADPRTFDNTIVAYDRLAYEGFALYNLCQLLADVSPEAEVRDAAKAGLFQLSGWFFQVMSNAALHESLTEFSGKQDDYSGEQKYLLERILTIFEGYGLGQDQETRDTIQQLNLQTEQVKQTIYSLLAQGDPEGETPELLATLVKSQTAWANLFGWDSYGAYLIDLQQAKTPEDAKAFVAEVASQLNPPFQALLAEFREIKATETGDAAAEIYYNDVIPYLDKWVAQNYQISDFSHRRFYEGVFAQEDVFATLFDIASTVFGIEIIAAVSPSTVWDEEVRYYQATDAETGNPLGSFYLDLYQREGKLAAPRLAPLIGPYAHQDGDRLRPVNVLIMDFPQPEEGSSILLSLYDTEAVFHEFGHLLKTLCSGNSYYYSSSVSGSRPDYQELNSQLLEQWLTDTTVIEALSGPNPVWSAEEIELWIQAEKNSLSVVNEKFQLFLAMFGLDLYTDYSTNDEIDPLAIQNTLLAEYYLPLKTGTVLNQIRGIYNHVNYPGTYYSYLWSEVIAYDVASQFRESNKGLMDPILGGELRQKIYTVNYDFDPEAGIQSFLGRPWNSEPYYEYYGVQQTP